jgi:hypothetical protein
VARARHGRQTQVLSEWNTPVRIVTPTGAIPISVVLKTPRSVYSTAE